MTFPIPGPPTPYLVENPNLSAQYMIPNFLLPYLSSWRWDYRRTALLYALANLDGPALADFYRFALYYRSLYSPQEVEMLNLVALKLAGSRDYIEVARRQFSMMLRNGMRFVKNYAKNARKARTVGGCGCGCEACNSSPGLAGYAFGVNYCQGYLNGYLQGSADDMQDDFNSMFDINSYYQDSDSSGSGSGYSDPESSSWDGGAGWGVDETAQKKAGGEAESAPGSSGSSGWDTDAWDGGAGWGNDEEAQKKAEDAWGSSWGSSSSTSKKRTSATAPKSQPTQWWNALPAMVKSATEVATKSYCLANPTNPMCAPNAPGIQNTPEWIAYCKQNAGFPGCQTLLQTNQIPIPSTTTKTPPPPPGTQAGLVNQTANLAQYYPIIGLVALAALGYLLLG